MTVRGNKIAINDFSGGLHSTVAVTEVAQNEAYDLSNVVIGPNGDYFRTRYGNSTFNSVAMNSGAAVQSLSYLKLINGNDFLVSVCGNKIFKSDALDGTMDDITGAVTITSGQNNIWTFITFNNLHIGFGGPSTGPDAPIQYTGAGNAAALSGTPPSAYGCVQGNNRVFAFRTAASPSIIQWSILGNPQDWTGTGSGSQTISTADNDSITAMAVLDNNVALVFKQNSVHKLMINTLVSGSFPSFILFRGTGCVGKHAVVVADGLCYFMTPQGRMKITDGITIIDDISLPQLAYVDNLWSAMNPSRYEYIQGRRIVGEDYDHVVWLMTSTTAGTTHDTAIIWDIKNKCWLRHKTGFKANVITTIQNGTPYTGHYAGIIYKQDVSSVTTDASESADNINSYWTSGWNDYGSFERFKSFQRAYISFVSQLSGNLNFIYGFNFNVGTQNEVINMRENAGIWDQSIWDIDLWGGVTDFTRPIFIKGVGYVFQYTLKNTDSKMKINSLQLYGTTGDK